LFFALFVPIGIVTAEPVAGEPDARYILVNIAASEIQDDTFQQIKELAGPWKPGRPRLGVGAIISYFREPPAVCRDQLRRLLALCEKHELAVIVQLDGEQWWNNRPDLWNWWDKTKPGYDPANAHNVEWSGWGPEHALKIAWRDWGQQWRVLPPPNLMSSPYRAACHVEMRSLLKEVVRWRNRLPGEKRWLFVGAKIGWESAIGMGSYYYPNGNALLAKDRADDPHWKIQPALLPGRGFQPIGYAAVSTARLANSGELREDHLAEVVRRHLDDLSGVARQAGLPREQIFTHSGGWVEGEELYQSALNEHSCPGWSFYRHARDPRDDKTAMAAVAASSAPYWAAAEWLPVGAGTSDEWHRALVNTLAVARCRYVCIYNWRPVRSNAIAREGIRRALVETIAKDAPGDGAPTRAGD
jgi:hypothetical protein